MDQFDGFGHEGIVGDVKNPDGKQYTRTNIKYKFKGAKSLLKSGLMGKAEIFLTN